MTTTTRLAIPLQAGGDDADLPAALNPALEQIDAKSATDDQGPFASRPAPTPALRGAYYWATDAKFLSRCDGAAWYAVAEFPIGGEISWPWAAAPPAPATWLELAGQSVLKASFPALFAAVGVTANSMNLPDRRGRTPVGAGQGPGLSNRTVGQTGGEEAHQLTFQELARHAHGWRWSNGISGAGPNGTIVLVGDASIANTTFSSAAPSENYTGGDLPHNNMQPFSVTRYFIRAA